MSSNYNISLIKFQSLHFHKCLALAAGKNEIKGHKALNRFCRMIGIKDFSTADIKMRGEINHLKHLSLIKESVILSSYGELEDVNTLKTAYLFYSHYLPNPYGNKKALDGLLYKMDSFFQFPFNENLSYSSNGDNIAVALARYFDFPELIEKQLAGIFMIYYDLYAKNLIKGFTFQDVLDFLNPELYHLNNHYFKLNEDLLAGHDNAGAGCYEKVTRFAANSLKDHQLACLKEFQRVSNTPLTLNMPESSLFDRALLKAQY